ncbi:MULTISPECIES: DUF2339 domain-containing protein [Bacillus]|uniref:DUF2339 domain-containing protein n=1 Tax=Bacillus TaxID=1386 RepID=UPI000BB7228F|nr:MULTISPECIES: DUF2339 domain-containing protein [Bacillus]
MDEKVLELSKRISRLENELAEVKNELRTYQVLRTEQQVTTHEPFPKKKLDSVAVRKHIVEKETKSFDTLVSEWLPRIFIFVLILGVIWGFVAAAERGWISPVVRVLFGFGLTGLLYWLGNLQYKKNKNSLSIVLLAGSVIVYVISIFAGNVLYDIIPHFVTVVLLGIGIAGGVYLSRKYQSEVLLAIVGVGAYVYPFLFAGDTRNEYVFYVYQTFVFVGLVYESVKQQYKVTWNIANYAFMFAVLVFTIIGVGGSSYFALTIIGLQQAVIIFLTYQAKNHTSKGMYIPAIATSALFLYGMGYSLFNNLSHLLIGFYIVMNVLYFALSMLRTNEHKELNNVFFVFSMFYLFLIITELVGSRDIAYMTFIVQAAVVYYLAQKRNSILGTVTSFVILLPVLDFLLDIPGEWFTFTVFVTWILFIGFFKFIYMLKDVSTVLKEYYIKNASPYILSLLVVIFFTKISAFFTKDSTYMMANIGVSISWIVFVAVAYISYSYFKHKHWNYIGLAFLFISLSKVTLFDLAMVDIVWRAILFITLGVIGLLISKVFYNSRKN